MSRVTLRRTLFVLAPLLVAAVVASTPAPAATATTRPLELTSPRLAEIGTAGFIPDATLSSTGARRLAAAAEWGGTFTASTGERVNISVSDTYPQDPALAQRWADFLASLVHGPELETVNVHLAPLSEVQRFCGQDALACYTERGNQLVAPGDDPDASTTAEAVVTHEYGHHIAASRNDAPWDAIAYGTKRWASYEQVCAQAAAGRLFPGAEDGVRYRLNPGEAFAESYRVLNQRRQGVAETPWEIVTRSLYPDDTALSLLQQDVLTPWSANASSSYTAPLNRRARVRTITFATPLDGVFRATVRGVRKAGVRIDLLTSAGTRLRTTTVAGASTRSLSATVCGTRTVRVKLTLTRGAGRFGLTVSKP